LNAFLILLIDEARLNAKKNWEDDYVKRRIEPNNKERFVVMKVLLHN